MNALRADAKTVDLRSQASHFYSFAARILELFEDEEMVDILTEVIAKTYGSSLGFGNCTAE